jgi:hypothetical protein
MQTQIIQPNQPTYILTTLTRQGYEHRVGVFTLEDVVREAARSYHPVVVKNLAGEVVVGGDRLRDAVARYLRYREQQMA